MDKRLRRFFFFIKQLSEANKVNKIQRIEKSLLKKESIKKRLETINKRSKLKMCNVHLSENWILLMDELVLEGRFPNRAELMRYAIKQLLDEEIVLSFIKNQCRKSGV